MQMAGKILPMISRHTTPCRAHPGRVACALKSKKQTLI
jgi:hypothetical protein